MSFQPKHIEEVIEQSMMEGLSEYFSNNDNTIKSKNNLNNFLFKIKQALKTILSRSYWTKENFVEACGFATKVAIIFPGLLLGYQWWWLYIFAIASSIALIWSSTVKTLPTIIIFNVLWVILASIAILKHFF